MNPTPSADPSANEAEFTNAPRLWINTWLFLLTFIGASTIVPWYGITHGYTRTAWLSFILLWGANGVAITAGYHRLWAHRAYEAHWSVRFMLLVFGTMALESSVLTWCSGHRTHHRFIDDNQQDPYSAKRGFWFSHIGWMLHDYPSGRRNDNNVKDLAADPMLAFQDRHYVSLVLLTNIGLPLLLGWMLGDLWGVFLLGGLLRMVVNHHSTFFINSLAHMWGTRPYTDSNTARDNGLLAFFTHGEGYHNFHHWYASDYRNGVRWWQWDPTKWLIFSLSKLGLAHNLRRVPAVKIQHARLAQQLKQMEAALARKQTSLTHIQWQKLRAQWSHEYDALKAALEQWLHAREQWFDTQRGRFNQQTRDTLKQMRELNLRLQWLDTEIAAAC